jgi:6,7-dimethyl-8-ribityllumazine synthase
VRFAVVRALFNGDITERLLAGARRAFEEAKVSKRDIATFEVPGSFELPLAALWLAKSGKYNAIVCLGCVIRGETAHFEYVAEQAASGIGRVSLLTGVPVIFGVLTTDNIEQAQARSADVARGQAHHSGAARGANKGYEAAQSALHMAAMRRSLRPKR